MIECHVCKVGKQTSELLRCKQCGFTTCFGCRKEHQNKITKLRRTAPDEYPESLKYACPRCGDMNLSQIAHPKKSANIEDFISFCNKGIINSVQSFLNSFPEAARTELTDGETILHQAVAADRIAIAEILLAKGADPNAQDNNGWAPLHRAALKADAYGLALADLLIAHGANPRLKKADGITPLHFASEVGNEALVSLLIDKGANPNEKDQWDGSTPLHVAAANGRDGAVKVLLQRGAKANALNNNSLTPLQLAKRYGRESTADLLFRYEKGGWDGLKSLLEK